MYNKPLLGLRKVQNWSTKSVYMIDYEIWLSQTQRLYFLKIWKPASSSSDMKYLDSSELLYDIQNPYSI